MKPHPSAISNVVMSRITSKEIKMRPWIYFFVGSLFIGMGFALSLVLTTLFVGFILLQWRMVNPFGFVSFGTRGLGPMFTTIPWFLCAGAMFFLSLGVAIARRYDFSYKLGFMGIVSGFLITAVGGALILDGSNLSQRLAQSPLIRPYIMHSFSGSDWMIGTVNAIENGSLILETPTGETSKVTVDKGTLLPMRSEIKVGDRIRVVGERQGNTFKAKGIGKGDHGLREGHGRSRNE